MEKVQTTCPYCGSGCNIDLFVENGRIVKAEPTKNHPVNDGNLCLKAWYGWEYVHAPDRLKRPLIRKKNGVFSKDGDLVESSWGEALELITKKSREIREKYGPDAFMGFSSARCLNEDNYVFQKFFRVAIGTNNIDHCARL